MRVVPGLKSYVKNYKLGSKAKLTSAQRVSVAKTFKMTRAGGGIGITAHSGRAQDRRVITITPRSGGSSRHAAAIKAWETRRRGGPR